MRYSDFYMEGENQWLEFKESFGKEIIETVVAFSNASGGTILIGVDKNGRIKGVTISEETLKEWINAIKQATQPQIFPEITFFEKEGKTLVAVRVQEYPIKPVCCKGRYFKRVGASNHLIPLDEIVEMQLYSINSSFDSFKVSQTPDDLNMDLVANFFRNTGNAGRISLHNDPVLNLRKIGLLKDDQLTFAALLLFGEHQTGIHIGRFKSPDVIIDDILIRSPLVIAVDEAMTFIKKNLSLRYDFTGELRRKETWQYPLPVIRELLLNSVIHKDYRNPTDVMIKIYDNSIRFVNPGSLMGGLSLEYLLKGDYIAIHRNKLLAEAFYLLGEIEKFGTGFSRIQSELKNTPEIRFNIECFDGFIRTGLDLPVRETGTPQGNGQVTAQDTPQGTQQDTPQYTPQVHKLVMILQDSHSREEIQELLGLSDREHVRKMYINPSLNEGLIEMTIPDKPNSKYQKYRLTEKGKHVKTKIKNGDNA